MMVTPIATYEDIDKNRRTEKDRAKTSDLRLEDAKEVDHNIHLRQRRRQMREVEGSMLFALASQRSTGAMHRMHTKLKPISLNAHYKIIIMISITVVVIIIVIITLPNLLLRGFLGGLLEEGCVALLCRAI